MYLTFLYFFLFGRNPTLEPFLSVVGRYNRAYMISRGSLKSKKVALILILLLVVNIVKFYFNILILTLIIIRNTEK